MGSAVIADSLSVRKHAVKLLGQDEWQTELTWRESSLRCAAPSYPFIIR